MKMLVSHECPISLLPESREFNDFDYALVHLFETHPEYYSFFQTSLLMGREVLLDNSIFELGVAFDGDLFHEWICKLTPTCYIIPDVLENAEGTIEQCEEWLSFGNSNTHPYVSRKIGVVQGKTFKDLVKCYRYMCREVDQLAISFDYSYYQTTGIGDNRLELNMTGRQRFITDLIREGIWDYRKPVHLLGCSLAREFSFYVDHNISNIRSCDTSNPIVAGIEGKRYDNEFGLNTKSVTKLADKIDIVLTTEQKEDVFYNVNQFKRILRRCW